jgi:hypothetical protein
MSLDYWYYEHGRSRHDLRNTKGGHLGHNRLKNYTFALDPNWLADLTTAGVFSLDAMKAHLRVDGTDEDSHITGLMDAAAVFILQQVNFPYLPCTVSADYYEFPPGRDPIVLPFEVVRGEATVGVESVDYPNTPAATTIPVPFAVSLDNNMIYPTSEDDVWPVDYSYDSPSPVKVTVTYDAPSDLSVKPILTALQMLVGYWYNAREAVVECRPEVLPLAFNVLVENARKHYIARN